MVWDSTPQSLRLLVMSWRPSPRPAQSLSLCAPISANFFRVLLGLESSPGLAFGVGKSPPILQVACVFVGVLLKGLLIDLGHKRRRLSWFFRALEVNQRVFLRSPNVEFGGMANGSRRGAAGFLFSDEELKEMSVLKKGEDFVEVTCGCTSRRYGDAVGKLKVFASGDLEITCDCTPGCVEGKLTPAAFEKHSGKEAARRWKYNVWVLVKGKKTPLLKTALLKYHDKASKSARGSHRQNGRYHRDEFICCTRCNKERRFRLQTKEECRTYHDALACTNWKCSDFPFDSRLTCDAEEERASRRVLRGCPRATLCEGCITCVCFGCKLCCFSDCGCQTCVDFTTNAEI